MCVYLYDRVLIYSFYHCILLTRDLTLPGKLQSPSCTIMLGVNIIELDVGDSIDRTSMLVNQGLSSDAENLRNEISLLWLTY